MKYFIFIGKFSASYELKNRAFPPSPNRKKQHLAAFSRTARAPRVSPINRVAILYRTRTTREFYKQSCYTLFDTHVTHYFSSQCVFSLFLRLFECFFFRACLRTWDKILSTCNLFVGLLNLHFMSFIFHEVS